MQAFFRINDELSTIIETARKRGEGAKAAIGGRARTASAPPSADETNGGEGDNVFQQIIEQAMKVSEVIGGVLQSVRLADNCAPTAGPMELTQSIARHQANFLKESVAIAKTLRLETDRLVHMASVLKLGELQTLAAIAKARGASIR